MYYDYSFFSKEVTGDYSSNIPIVGDVLSQELIFFF
jgi:hypothetical protein